MNVSSPRRRGGLRLLLFNTTGCVSWQETAAVATFRTNMQEKPWTGSLEPFWAHSSYLNKKNIDNDDQNSLTLAGGFRKPTEGIYCNLGNQLYVKMVYNHIGAIAGNSSVILYPAVRLHSKWSNQSEELSLVSIKSLLSYLSITAFSILETRSLDDYIIGFRI